MNDPYAVEINKNWAHSLLCGHSYYDIHLVDDILQFPLLNKLQNHLIQFPLTLRTIVTVNREKMTINLVDVLERQGKALNIYFFNREWFEKWVETINSVVIINIELSRFTRLKLVEVHEDQSVTYEYIYDNSGELFHMREINKQNMDKKDVKDLKAKYNFHYTIGNKCYLFKRLGFLQDFGL